MTTPTQMPESLKVVRDSLRNAPIARAAANHYGWGNICTDAADAIDALQSALKDRDAEIERLKKDAERLPADLPTRIQVSYSPDDWDTFIFGVSGQLTMEALTAINASIHEDAEALFDKGPGEYLLSASHFKGQYGFEGRCEIAPGWELSVESFVPLDAAIDSMKGDANG